MIQEGHRGGFAFVNYLTCAGNSQSVFVPYGSSRIICMLQNSPGDPVVFTSSVPVTIVYTAEC